MVDLETLNEKQKSAVLETEKSTAVLSCAGSGKTRTMVKKLEYLLNEKEILPSRIWACTFTNKAADEMRDRLVASVGEIGNKVKLSTLHSLAYQIYKAGKQFREPYYKMPKILTFTGGVLSHLYSFCNKNKLSNKDAKAYLSIIANLKLDLIKPADYKAKHYIDVTSIEIDGYSNNLERYEENVYFVYREYEKWKLQNNYMDFQDMLVWCHDLLADEKYKEYRDRLSKRCEYILVDEAQDTNTVSFKILDFLAEHHKRVTIVGDMRQLIYSFQGARMENLHNFIKKYNPDVIDLNVNYRSTKAIVEASNNLIRGAVGVIGADATTPNAMGEHISYFTSECQVDEAGSVLNKIETLLMGGTKLKDITVLYRVHSQAVALEDQLIINQIPYMTFSKQSFYERKEVKDITTYLDIFCHPEKLNTTKLKRIANRPTRFVSNKSIKDLEFNAMDEDYTMWEALENIYTMDELAQRDKDCLNILYLELRGGVRLKKKGATTKELCDYILQEVGPKGYEQFAIDEVTVRDVESDVELNFGAILDSVTSWDNPVDYLEFVEKVRAESKVKKDENGDYIKLMTIHASKGKEFKNVIILGLCNRLYPFYRATEEGNNEEEKRVLYVAMTRPEKKLYLSVIDGNLGRYKVQPSPYLHKMGINYLGGCNDH